MLCQEETNLTESQQTILLHILDSSIRLTIRHSKNRKMAVKKVSTELVAILPKLIAKYDEDYVETENLRVVLNICENLDQRIWSELRQMKVCACFTLWMCLRICLRVLINK